VGPVTAYASLVIFLLALVVAGVSALYARTQSAAQARATAIEDDRWHDELTPVSRPPARSPEIRVTRRC
jgi:hypothetical protein